MSCVLPPVSLLLPTNDRLCASSSFIVLQLSRLAWIAVWSSNYWKLTGWLDVELTYLLWLLGQLKLMLSRWKRRGRLVGSGREKTRTVNGRQKYRFVNFPASLTGFDLSPGDSIPTLQLEHTHTPLSSAPWFWSLSCTSSRDMPKLSMSPLYAKTLHVPSDTVPPGLFLASPLSDFLSLHQHTSLDPICIICAFNMSKSRAAPPQYNGDAVYFPSNQRCRGTVEYKKSIYPTFPIHKSEILTT